MEPDSACSLSCIHWSHILESACEHIPSEQLEIWPFPLQDRRFSATCCGDLQFARFKLSWINGNKHDLGLSRLSGGDSRRGWEMGGWGNEASGRGLHGCPEGRPLLPGLAAGGGTESRAARRPRAGRAQRAVHEPGQPLCPAGLMPSTGSTISGTADPRGGGSSWSASPIIRNRSKPSPPWSAAGSRTSRFSSSGTAWEG